MPLYAKSPKAKPNKLAEAIIYIAEKSKKDPRFGAVKLNKILYYSDFYAYRKLGKPITGTEYQHLEEGPAPRALLPVRKKLIADGSIGIKYKQYFQGVQERLVAKRRPNIKIFTQRELKILDEVMKSLLPLNGTETSNLSHREFGWRLTNNGETIPLRTAWLSSETPSMEQVELGKKIAEQHGLCAL